MDSEKGPKMKPKDGRGKWLKINLYMGNKTYHTHQHISNFCLFSFLSSLYLLYAFVTLFFIFKNPSSSQLCRGNFLLLSLGKSQAFCIQISGQLPCGVGILMVNQATKS